MKPRIIYDTDIGCDCDDAAALAIALELMNAEECDLLAVTTCVSDEAAAGCIEAILQYYGHPNIPIGSFHVEDHLVQNEWHNVYASDIANRYNTKYSNSIRYKNTVEIMRSALASADDQSITIVDTGALTSLDRLLRSKADGISCLSGLELVRAKVKRTVCMGGRFQQHWKEPIIIGNNYVVEQEWNIKGDVEAAKKVCEVWPNELIFSSYETGLSIITGGELQTKGPLDHPVRLCYETWSKKEGNGKVGRESWDPTTMLFAIRPNHNYWDLFPFGKIIVDDVGTTIYNSDKSGKHSFLIERMKGEEIQNTINEILNRAIL